MLYTKFEVDAVLNTLDGIVSEKTLMMVQRAYDHADRSYHDFDHAIEVLSWINRACEDAPEQDLQPFTHQELRLAALFHDVVYTTVGSPTNEQQSCELMRQLMGDALPGDSLDRVAQLIMLTAQHGKLGAEDVPLAGQLMLDADIANMGHYHWEIFLYNNHNVVEELRLKYTDEQIAVGRKAFLGGLLANKSIYLSDWFRSRFEEQARRNLSRVLAS